MHIYVNCNRFFSHRGRRGVTQTKTTHDLGRHFTYFPQRHFTQNTCHPSPIQSYLGREKTHVGTAAWRSAALHQYLPDCKQSYQTAGMIEECTFYFPTRFIKSYTSLFIHSHKYLHKNTAISYVFGRFGEN